MLCERCSITHDGSYASGRFCSSYCARGFSTSKRRSEINQRVSLSLKGRPNPRPKRPKKPKPARFPRKFIERSSLEQKVLELYPGFLKVYGPYKRKKDSRKHFVLVFSKKKKTSLSYPKALLEISLGRRLTGEETTDHIDENYKNDGVDNLQILTRSKNVSKSMLMRGRGGTQTQLP